MGAVFVAEHTLIGRKSAIKVLLPEVSTNKEVVTRFFNEARASAVIKHPGLIEVFDFGYHTDGSAYIVMEFLEGESLAARLKREVKLPVDVLIAVARQVASALGAAHVRGIVHRDLKPDNVFLVPDPELPSGFRCKVLDFGIAKLAGEAAAGNSLKTRTGTVMGTPVYMSPEQCRGAGQVDARADIYSLGCILFEMACGRPPFIKEGLGELLAAQMLEAPPAPRTFEPKLSLSLQAVILRSLAKKPEERQQSMEQLKGELDVVSEGRHQTGPVRKIAMDDTLAATEQAAPSDAAAAGRRSLNTLSDAAAEAVREHTPRRSRSWGFALGGLGVAVLGAFTYFGARRASAPIPTAVPVEHRAVAETSPPPPPAVVNQSVALRPKPSRVTLRIESRPTGAEVYRAADGVRVGTTPWSSEGESVPGQAVFVVKRVGYRDETVELDAERGGSRDVVLARAPNKRGGIKTAVQPAAMPATTTPAPPPSRSTEPKRVGESVIDPFSK